MLKSIYLALFILLSTTSTIWGNFPDYDLNTMNQQKLNLGKLQQYPILIIISPQFETTRQSVHLYQQLYQNLKNQAYLLVAPDLSFFASNETTLNILTQKIDDDAQSGVVLDWDRNFVTLLSAENSEDPLVLLLEEDGTILGRYHYQTVTDAFEFVANTFSDLLPFHATELWANSPLENQSLSQETNECTPGIYLENCRK
ncbi:MAG: hypothetical protein HQM14_02070 [SAR324 cluster bacterium]|nr:hypothetical protein [SAR324 cluster bacterium]